MFTGIIQGKGRLTEVRQSGGGRIFGIESGFPLDHPQEGESIAVNGVCLTAREIDKQHFLVDVSPESLARTNLGHLKTGHQVNLERALRLSDRLGGHLVSGHVDCSGQVISRTAHGDFTLFDFKVPEKICRYIVEKGSITIDGISLTVNAVAAGNFSVSIIPHTLQITMLGALKPGDQVNIEVDIIGKYIEKLMSPEQKADSASKIDMTFLAEHGFMK